MNPNSILSNVPQGEFNSRYADPKNHAASGSLISFVSGGRLVPEPHSRGLVGGLVSVAGQAMRGERQGEAWERQDDPRYDRYSRNNKGKGRMRSRSSSGKISTLVARPIAKVLGKVCLLYCETHTLERLKSGDAKRN